MEKLSHSAELVRVLYVLGWVRSYWFNRMVDYGGDEMTDKDNMAGLDTFAVGYAAAKQEDHKELEAAHTENIEQARLLGMGAERELSLIAKLEVAKQRIKELEENLGHAEMAAEAEAKYANELLAANKALEKKLATSQANVEFLSTGVDDFWLAEHGHLFDDNGVFIGGTEELTKLLSSSRQQGFEEGKQAYKPWYDAVTDACVIDFIGWDETDARKSLNKLMCYEQGLALDPQVSEDAVALKQSGRDEVQKELSEQDPVGYVREWEGDVSDLGNFLFEADKSQCDDSPNWIAVIPRPLPPERRVFLAGEEAAWLADKIVAYGECGNDAARLLRLLSLTQQDNEKLQAQVEMLVNMFNSVWVVIPKETYFDKATIEKANVKLINLTASSDAWMKEQKAGWLEEAAREFDGDLGIVSMKLRRMASELRDVKS